MPEAYPYRVETVDLDSANDIFRVVERNLQRPRFTDPVEAAFIRASYPEFFDGGRLRPHLEEALAFRRTRDSYFPPGYALRTLEFSIDKQARRLTDKYPVGFDKPEAWEEVYANLDPYELVWDMQLNLQSSMADAYAIYHLLSQVFHKRLGKSPTVIDNGGSMAMGLKKWLLPGAGFKPIRVVNTPKPDQPIVPGEMPVDEAIQGVVNSMTQENPTISRAVCYDIMPINTHDQDAIDRVFSHTFPMSESLRRPDEVEEFLRLSKASSPKIILPQMIIDAQDTESLARISNFLPEKADMAIFSAVLFEQSEDDINTIFENVAAHCNESALFFITDFIKPDDSTPHGFSFIRGDWWHRPGSFATFVMDPSEPGRPAEEIARFSTRRSTEMWLTPRGRELFLNA
jgi:hypothetical protein